MLKKLTLLIFILGTLTNSGIAQGTSAGNFLKIGIGARPVAMGESYTALANGADAAYWNPAGLATLKSFEILSMNANWLQETSLQYLGIVYPAGELGNFGLSYRYLNYGMIAGYDASGSREADVTAADNALTLSWGKYINKSLSFGLNVHMVSEYLDNIKAETVSADLGLLLEVSPRMNVGVNFINQIGELKFIQEQNPLPRKTVVGVGLTKFMLNPLTLSADYNLPHNEEAYVNYGCEYDFSDYFALRFGYAQSRVQGGIGFKAPYFDLDYAYVPYENIGVAHRLSFALRFGIRKEATIEKHYELGKMYYREDKYLDALSEFRKVLEIDPVHRDSREFVDRIVEEMRQKTLLEKVRALREQLKKSNNYLEKAVVEFQKRNYNKAGELVDKSIELAPGNKRAIDFKKRLGKFLKIKKEGKN
ncbi:MAG: PorV/PorQ family protein [Candidatus Margulisiibacteriota bacterium]|nr:PorV/PorQ family protein [Candidatus Margulisiibacteriota bacterium]